MLTLLSGQFAAGLGKYVEGMEAAAKANVPLEQGVNAAARIVDPLLNKMIQVLVPDLKSEMSEVTSNAAINSSRAATHRSRAARCAPAATPQFHAPRPLARPRLSRRRQRAPRRRHLHPAPHGHARRSGDLVRLAVFSDSAANNIR